MTEPRQRTDAVGSRLIPTDGDASHRGGNAGSGYGWAVMAVLWILDGAVTIMIFSLGMLLPEMREDIGFGAVEAGLLGATFFIAMTTGSLPSAIWLTRFNPVRITMLAAFGMALAALAQGFAPNYALLMVARMAFMYLAVSRIQAEVLIIQQWFSGPRILTINSITIGSFGVGQLVAIGATPLLLPLVGGWRGIHVAAAILYFIIAIAWTVVGRERRYQNEVAEPASASHTPGVVVNGVKPMNVFRRHPILFLLASTQFGGAIAWASFITFFPTFGVDDRGLTLAEVGRAFLFFSVGATVGSFAAGYISNRIGRRKPLIYVPGFIMPIAYVAVLTVSPAAWIPLLVVLGFATSVVVPMVLTFPFDLGLAPREVAIAVGLIRTITPLGSTIGPPLVGVLQETTGSLETALMWVLPLSFTVGVIGLLLPETSPMRKKAATKFQVQ